MLQRGTAVLMVAVCALLFMGAAEQWVKGPLVGEASSVSVLQTPLGQSLIGGHEAWGPFQLHGNCGCKQMSYSLANHR